jgi:hypothetical protein
MRISLPFTRRWLRTLLVVAPLIGAVESAHATEMMACIDGTIVACVINGQPGERECVSGRWTPCMPTGDPAPTPSPTPTPGPVTGTVRPQYAILTVVYAPPGTQGGTPSSVSYGSGSSTGIVTSTTHSFKQGYGVTASGGVITKIGGSFNYTRSSSRTDAMDIKKVDSTTITVRGPGVDGIHHDRDLIYLWLNPQVRLDLTPTSAAWTFGDTSTADIQYVYVGWLQNPSSMPPGVVSRLQSYGITPAEYPEILKADPFATANTIDPARFIVLNTTFPYEPPFAPGDPVPTYSFTQTFTGSSSTSTTAQSEYNVKVTAETGFNFFDLFKASLKAEGSWTWTNTSAGTTSAGVSETATVTVGGPSFGYAGPTDMAVYYDVLNRSFLFAPVEGTLFSVQGQVFSLSGKSVHGKEIVLLADGVKHRTFVNSRGQYRFPVTPSGTPRLFVEGVEQSVSSLRVGDSINLFVQ